jgi:hypothetical protein
MGLIFEAGRNPPLNDDDIPAAGFHFPVTSGLHPTLGKFIPSINFTLPPGSLSDRIGFPPSQ